MKKKTLVNWLVLILFLIGSVAGKATVGPRVILSNWVNPMTMQEINMQHVMTIMLYEGAALHVNLKATTARVSLRHFPPLYIQYYFGDYSGLIGPLDDSDFISTTLPTGEEVKEAVFLNHFAFPEECNEDADINGIFELPVNYALVTMTSGPGLVTPYPILSHPTLFPPGWFDETSSPFPPPAYSDIKYVDCTGFYGTNPITRKANPTLEQETDETKLSFSSSTNPNPFFEDIKVIYQLSKASNINLSILDSRGKLVYQQRYLNKIAGLHEERLDLEQLSSGLYFIQLSNAEIVQTQRVIKL